jgi:hypothetical protein
MALSREMLIDLVATYGGGDYGNIDYVVTTNSDTIRLDWYETKGRGLNWVDKDLGGGNRRTGIELYNSIPHTIENNLEDNGTKTVTFIEIEALDRIAFKAPIAPSWAYKSIVAELKDLFVNGGHVYGFKKDVLTYDVVLPFGVVNVPVISASVTDNTSTMVITQSPGKTGQGKVVVTAQDSTTKTTYLINFTVASS